MRNVFLLHSLEQLYPETTKMLFLLKYLETTQLLIQGVATPSRQSFLWQVTGGEEELVPEGGTNHQQV